MIKMLSDPCKWWGDLQLGDQKVTLNHLGMLDLLVDPWEDMLNDMEGMVYFAHIFFNSKLPKCR